MPALVFLRRRWRIGSDDLVFPGLFEVVIRVSWLLLAIVLFCEHHFDSDDSPSCSEGNLLVKMYIYGLLAILTLNLSTAFLLIYHSSRGSIMSTLPRKHVPKILILRLCLGLLEVGWNILGTIWVLSDHVECDKDTTVWMLLKAQILFTWIATFIIVLSAYLLFEPMMRPDQDLHYSIRNRSILGRNSGAGTYYIQKWEKRCRILCCSFSKDEDSAEAFRNVADLFASFFETTNLVPSDIAAALVLLRLKRKQEEADEDKSIIFQGLVVNPAIMSNNGPSPEPISITSEIFTPRDWMTLKNAHHFCKFALASYGWPWYIYGNIWSCFSLGKHLQCCSCCRRSSTRGTKDNCCMCNLAALKAITNLPLENIIDVSFHNNIYEMPFFVAIDEESEHVVVSIRGTLSLKDAITDLNAQGTSLTSHGLPSGCLAHQGIVRSALYVRNKLNENHSLTDAFARHPSFRLAITGHSLGAGIAVILSAMLRPQYPSLKCMAFSPPGGLGSIELLQASKDYVFSVVVGDDLVPRLSVASIRDMHSNILTALRSCDKAKYRVLARGCWYMCCGISRSSLQHALPPSDASTPSQEDLLSTLSAGSVASYESVSIPEVVQVLPRQNELPLYVPGVILHIRPSVPYSAKNPWTYKWSNAKEFEKIVISPNMMKHHLPNNVFSALECLI